MNAFPLLFTAFLCVLLLFGPGSGAECFAAQGALTATQPNQGIAVTPGDSSGGGCRACHEKTQQLHLDANHGQLACVSCHAGRDGLTEEEPSHQGLIAWPAHPRHMARSCGPCHPAEVAAATASRHFTLAGEVNAVRQHFGADQELQDPEAIPVANPLAKPFATELALADDMLRRRCLRCHVYSPGDYYTAAQRGTGCAACHLVFSDGNAISHAFVRPTDNQCLSCHYGNYVGSDYYGRYEQDFHWEYRTPYLPFKRNTRPYGVENHNLSPDIHQQRGLGCVDCHPASGHQGVMLGKSRQAAASLTCMSCHGWQPGMPLPLAASSRKSYFRQQGTQLLLHSQQSGREHPVPALQHPAHAQYAVQMDCQVCHAQWSMNDGTVSLLLKQDADFSAWEMLGIQSSAAVEDLIEHGITNASSDEADSAEGKVGAFMQDGLSGELRPGIWLMAYSERRWERICLGRDKDGRIRVFRPVLDLRLSMVDAAGQIRFENLRGRDGGVRPYTPHTTGPAGLFYRERFRGLLETVPAGKPATSTAR